MNPNRTSYRLLKVLDKSIKVQQANANGSVLPSFNTSTLVMQFKFSTFLAVAVLAVAASAKCDCDYSDQSCVAKCAQDFQRCQQRCYEKQDGQSCLSDCQKDAPQGMGMGMGNYGGNFPQNGYQAQGYGGGYGAGHWQNGQWISAANGLTVQYAALAVPALAGVAAGMVAL